MEKEFTEVYCGSGKGKTTLAVGQCLRASANGKSVIIIQFLKGKERRELDFLEELENQDIKIFRFEKMEKCYEQLNDQEKEEENFDIEEELELAKAEGESVVIEQVFKAMKDADIDDNMLALKSMGALEKVAQGKSTKLVLPSDAVNFLGTFKGIKEVLSDAQDDNINKKGISPEIPFISF